MGKDTNSQQEIIIYGKLHSTAEYTFFSRAHRTNAKIHTILHYKTSFNKGKRIEITETVFSDHNKIKLEVNNNKTAWKTMNNWK